MLKILRRMACLLLRGVCNRHPGFSDLLAYHNGELEAVQRASIAAHLTGCAQCQSEMNSIGLSLELSERLLNEDLAVPSMQESLDRILKVVQDEGLLAGKREHLQAEWGRRMSVALSEYFGHYPEYLCRAACSDAALRAEAARLAQLFLGKRAAAALVRRIDVETGIA